METDGLNFQERRSWRWKTRHRWYENGGIFPRRRNFRYLWKPSGRRRMDQWEKFFDAGGFIQAIWFGSDGPWSRVPWKPFGSEKVASPR
jgi:hypothetical protein